jgi:hypothetical protein
LHYLNFTFSYLSFLNPNKKTKKSIVDAAQVHLLSFFASHRDLLKQGAHVLDIAYHERPTHVLGQKVRVANGGYTLTPHHVVLVPNGEQGDGGAIEDRQVALTELREGFMGSPRQSVVEVIDPIRGEPSHHGQVKGVSRDVHVDLTASTPK